MQRHQFNVILVVPIAHSCYCFSGEKKRQISKAKSRRSARPSVARTGSLSCATLCFFCVGLNFLFTRQRARPSTSLTHSLTQSLTPKSARLDCIISTQGPVAIVVLGARLRGPRYIFLIWFRLFACLLAFLPSLPCSAKRLPRRPAGSRRHPLFCAPAHIGVSEETSSTTRNFAKKKPPPGRRRRWICRRVRVRVCARACLMILRYGSRTKQAPRTRHTTE